MCILYATNTAFSYLIFYTFPSRVRFFVNFVRFFVNSMQTPARRIATLAELQEKRTVRGTHRKDGQKIFLFNKENFLPVSISKYCHGARP